MDNALKTPEEELVDKQTELADLKGNATLKEAEINAYKGMVAEFKQATDGYNDAFITNATDRLNKIMTNNDERKATALRRIKNNKAGEIENLITEKIDESGKNINNLEKKVKGARTNLNKAASAVSAAEKKLQESQMEYELLRQSRESIESQLKEFENMITLADNAHDHNEYERMYLLALSVHKLLKSNPINIQNFEDYKKALHTAMTNVGHNKSDAEESKKWVEQARKDLADKTKQYNDAIASEQSGLLKKLKEIKLEIEEPV